MSRLIRRALAVAALAAFFAPAPARAQASGDDLADRAAAVVRGYVQLGIFDDVSISVSDRVVTLSGRVTMPFKRQDLAARLAKVDGIDEVVNAIEVLPVSQSDSGLRIRLARAIYSHPAFWHYASMANPPIHIVVERGRVTLTGWVNSEVERMLAYALAQVEGTFSVENRLRLDGR